MIRNSHHRREFQLQQKTKGTKCHVHDSQVISGMCSGKSPQQWLFSTKKCQQYVEYVNTEVVRRLVDWQISWCYYKFLLKVGCKDVFLNLMHFLNQDLGAGYNTVKPPPTHDQRLNHTALAVPLFSYGESGATLGVVHHSKLWPWLLLTFQSATKENSCNCCCCCLETVNGVPCALLGDIFHLRGSAPYVSVGKEQMSYRVKAAEEICAWWWFRVHHAKESASAYSGGTALHIEKQWHSQRRAVLTLIMCGRLYFVNAAWGTNLNCKKRWGIN